VANGAILKFNYTAVLVILWKFLGDWRTFEGWCTSVGINPLTEGSRRMINLMFYFVERDMDDESREKFRNELDYMSVNQLVKQAKPITDKTLSVIPKKRWQAPPGWTPPGWSDERSYQSAKDFMAFQRNPK